MGTASAMSLAGERELPQEIEAIYALRKDRWVAPDYSGRKGVYRQYAANATSLMAGAYIP